MTGDDLAIRVCAIYRLPLRLVLPQYVKWSNAERRRANKTRAVYEHITRKADRTRTV